MQDHETLPEIETPVVALGALFALTLLGCIVALLGG